jgi:hypothetical protein
VLVTDREEAIEPAHVDAAAKILIERNDTHLDSLSERLREPRVRADRRADDRRGDAAGPPERRCPLRVRPRADPSRGVDGTLEVGNPIYKDVIVRELMFVPRVSLPKVQPTWLAADGRLDAEKLLAAFVAFWRRHAEPLMRAAPYHEIAPHLVLMAYLDRVANGGGTVDREYAIGSGRVDLCLRHGGTVVAIELKVWRPSTSRTRSRRGSSSSTRTSRGWGWRPGGW